MLAWPSFPQAGTVDSSWNSGISANGSINSVAEQEDGMILLAGYFAQFQGIDRAGIVRTTSCGVIDMTYMPPILVNSNIQSIDIDAGGGCILGGLIYVQDFGVKYLIRLHPSGAFDEDFNDNLGNGPNDVVYSLAIRGNGNIVFCGDFAAVDGFSRPRLAEIHGNGILDVIRDYGGGSVLFSDSLNPGSTFGFAVSRVNCSPLDEKVLVRGTFSHFGSTNVRGFASIYPDGLIGSLMPSFMIYEDGYLVPGLIRDLIVTPNGRIVCVGAFEQVNGNPAPGIVMFNDVGDILSHYNLLPDTINNWDYSPWSINSDGDNGFYLLYGRQFPIATNFLTNIDSSGLVRSDFITSESTSYSLLSSSYVQNDGNIIVGGSFSTWESIVGIVRLHGRNGPAIWQCLNTEPQALSGNDAIAFSLDTIAWRQLEVDHCMQLTISSCDTSSINNFGTGLYTSCPAYPDSIVPFTYSLPNSCGGMDWIVEDLAPGTYWLAPEGSGGNYAFSITTLLCGATDCVEVPGGMALPGTPCDDGDSATINDVWNTACECVGEPNPNLDCTGIPNGPAVPGTPCNDGILWTSNDTWTESCECAGNDCEGNQGGSALPGTPCDDGDPTTLMDQWTVDCTCGAQVGVHEFAFDPSAIQIRPNPCAQDHFELVMGASSGQQIEIRLFDAAMRTVQTKVSFPVGNGTVQIDRSNIPAGFYFIEIRQGQDRSLQRIILQ